ncbi:MAG: hypothetical protein A2052_05345 [Deltaproteobacteria bacterium GWA2_54_12]|nr:MAG: hypothetical protein A2052_05345 [Deltaproteobacteria bacterium GWA2_54_12]
MKFFSKRALWAFALAATAVVLVPGQGFCVEEDMYIYRLLFGRVYFEYESGTTEDNGISRDRSRFLQSYALDTLGNILSRRLMTYDAEVNFTLDSYEQGSTAIDTENVNYYLKTTVLPKSNIPLSLYGSRLDETLTTTSVTERTRTIYGMNWLMRFRTLPDTNIQIERQNDTAQSSDMTTTLYNVNMSKQVGPTENSLYYNLNTTEDNLRDGRGSQSMSINATNRTKLSRSTIFDLGLSRGDNTSDNSESPDMTINAVTVGLQSRPSLEFNQSHRFTYYGISTDGSDSTNSNYTGNMSYRFTDRLDSNLSLTTGESTSDTPDKSESTTSMGAGFGLNYRISKKLTMSETVNYNRFDTSANTDTNQDRELFRALTHLTYSDQLSWAQLTSSLRLGYNKDKTTEELSGSGIEQGVSAALTNIDINRYFIFNTSVDWNRVYNLSGDVWSKNNSYQVSAFNKLWRRYAQLSAKFDRSSQSSWVSAAETSAENWSVGAASSYFRSTKIEATSEHTKTFDTVTGDLSTDSELLTVTHNRYLAGGAIDLGFTYNLVSNSFPGGSNEFSSMGAFARYNKKLLRNLDWRAGASVIRGEGDNASFKNITAFDNLLSYPMRSWLLSLEQKYIHTEDQNRDLVENTFLFRAMRQFLWML